MVGRPRRTGRWGTAATTSAVAMAVLAGGVASCSSKEAAKPAAAARASAAPSPIPSYDPKKGARSDATAGTCAANDDGDWVFAGTVRNSAKQKRSYEIVVDFVTDKGSTVVDTKLVKVADVAPAAAKGWTATGAAGKDDLRCVIRSVQFG